MKLVEKKLEELYIVKDGTHDSPKYVSAENGFPFLTSKNLKKGFIDLTEVDYVSEEDYKKINLRSKVDKGDLLFAMIGTIGNPVVVEEEPNFAIKNVALFKKNTDSNSLHYLKYILSSESFKKKLINDSTGGTQKFVSLGYLRKLKIPIPEKLSDQIRIAQILSQAESLIAQRKQSIGLLDELLKSIFLEMFGDPVRNEKGWDKDYFENLVASDCPLTYGIVQPGEEFSNGIPVIRPVDLTRTYIDRTGLKLIDPKISDKFKRTLLKGNEILMCVRGTTGIVSLASKELAGCNVTRGIVPVWFSKNYNSFFAFGLLKTKAINNEIQGLTYGATLQQINLSDLRKIKLINPPIALQTKFANIVEKVEALKGQYQQSLTELQNMYGVLSQKAFKGELKGNVEITN